MHLGKRKGSVDLATERLQALLDNPSLEEELENGADGAVGGGDAAAEWGHDALEHDKTLKCDS